MKLLDRPVHAHTGVQTWEHTQQSRRRGDDGFARRQWATGEAGQKLCCLHKASVSCGSLISQAVGVGWGRSGEEVVMGLARSMQGGQGHLQGLILCGLRVNENEASAREHARKHEPSWPTTVSGYFLIIIN